MSLETLPVELFQRIAENLNVAPDVQSLALCSKTLYYLCESTLYRTIEDNTVQWRDLFDSAFQGKEEAPPWIRHVRQLKVSRFKWGQDPLDLRRMTPLPGLTHFEATNYATLSPGGLDTLPTLAPFLQAFRWESPIEFDAVEQLPFYDMTDLELALETEWDADTYKSRIHAMIASDIKGTELEEYRILPRDISNHPFSKLASLSRKNPELRRLCLQLNYPADHPEAKMLAPAPADPILTSSFLKLTEFSLAGLLKTPDPKLLSSFLANHPSIQRFAFDVNYGDKSQPPQFPSSILPAVENIQATPLLMAAICATCPVRPLVTEIRGLSIWGTTDPEGVYTRDILPRLPNLRSLDIWINKVTPEWLETLGKSCVKLENLDLKDPEWVGALSDFERAFTCFPALKSLSSSDAFGELSEGSLSLPLAAARGAPVLSHMSWGDESSGCVISAQTWVSVQRIGNEVILEEPAWC